MEAVEKQPEAPPRDDLPERSLRALKWNYLGNGARSAAQLLIGVILARLLGPDVFGTVALAWLMVGLGMLCSDLGIGTAIVQRPRLIERDLRFFVTVQVAFGLALTLAGVASGGWIAAYFHKPQAAPVIRAMALLFLLQSFGQTPLSVLMHGLDFKSSQTINIASYVVGYVLVGVPLAYLGYGPWSLVLAQLIQAALSSALALWLARVPLRPALRPESRGLLTFGGKVVGSNFTSWAMLNLDSWMVGRALGTVSLGLYNRAMTLVSGPTTAVVSGMQGVLFSACSRTQHDVERVKRAYLGATMAIATLCLPVFVTVAVVPDAVVIGLLGRQWAEAATVLAPLALAMSVHAILAMVGPVLQALDRVATELRIQVVTLSLMVPLLWFATGRSIQVVAWGILALYLVRALLLIGSLLDLLDARWRDAAESLGWPAVYAIVTAAATWSADRLCLRLPPHLRLGADIVVAAVAVGILARLLGRRILCSRHGSFLLVGDRLPATLRHWLRV